jgi:peptide chain release factor 3
VRQLEKDPEGVPVSGPDDPLIDTLIKGDVLAKWRDEIELVKDLCTSFDRKAFLEGHLSAPSISVPPSRTSVSAICSKRLITYAPPPRDQQASARVVHATEPKMTGIVFKIQANMDPNHRDRIAFMRLASGKLTRGMKVKLVRTGKMVALNAPQFFFAQDRSIADEAFAGDVVGIPNHGLLRIGDTLTEGEDIVFTGVPSFAPEILRRVKLGDPMKAKKLRESAGATGGGGCRAALHSGGWFSGNRRRRRAHCSSTCWQIAWAANTAFPSPSSRRAMK